MSRIRRHLNYANVMSTIAVFAVLAGGSAWAASKIGTQDLENGAVTARKLHKKAVRTSKIAAGAVTSGKIGSGQVGAKALGTIRERSATKQGIPAGDSGQMGVQCHANEQVLSGGSDYGGTDVSITASRFEPPNGWRVFLDNEAASGDADLTVHAYCLAP
jgi:hypothetical protein